MSFEFVQDISQPELDVSVDDALLDTINSEVKQNDLSINELNKLIETLNNKNVSGSPNLFTPNQAIVKQKQIKYIRNLIKEIDDSIDQLTDTVNLQTKDFNISVDISNIPVAKKAVKKALGRKSNFIDKDMYLYAIKRYNDLQEKELEENLSNG